jgi:peptidoglycan hydrolase CwlO-like protein
VSNDTAWKLQDAQRETEAAAERTQGGLKRKLDQQQGKLEETIGERDKLTSDLAALQAALAKKVMEMNDAMHEATRTHQEEVSTLKSRHHSEVQANETTHCRSIAALKVSGGN